MEPKNEVLEIKRDCDNCIKNDVCKFLSDYNALVRSNKFYEMFEYLEWNNLERIFKANANAYKCYRQSFANGKINSTYPEDVIQEVFVHKFNGELSSWSYDNKTGDFKFQTKLGEKKVININDIDIDVKVV